MGNMQYAEMKDSGVEWIGEIPKHWSKDKIARIFKIIGSGTTPKFDDSKDNSGTINWIQSGDINGSIITDVNNHIAEFFLAECSALKVFKPPFIIVAMYGASIGNMAISHIPGCVNQACCVLSSPQIDFSYAYRALQATKASLLRRALGGGQPNISQQTIKSSWLPVPPDEEQVQISSYLDDKCTAIDDVIAQAKETIEEYKSWKASVIFEAVTKGLDPNVEMKDSGVEWIGQIPKEWTQRRLKSLLKVLRGGSPRPIEEYLTDAPDGINWIKIGDTIKGEKCIYSTKQKIKPSGCAKSRMVHRGDLLLTNSMSFGEPYFLEVDGCIHDGWVCLTQLKGIDKLFLYYFLRSNFCMTQFQLQVDGGVVQNLNIDKIGDTFVYLPPSPIQAAIASYLDDKCSAIDSIIFEKQVLIDELESYKKSLIFETVTGKRRVC